MMRRVKRFALVSALVLLVGAGALAALEWHRRQQVMQVAQIADPGAVSPGTPGPAGDLEQRYRAPSAFDALCAAVQERFGALQARHVRSQHLRALRVTELDRRDRAVAITEMRDRVHFEGLDGRKECTNRLEVRAVLGTLTDDTNFRKGMSSNALAPFSDDTPSGLYRYSLEGIETGTDRPVVRIRFEPVEPVEGSFTGSVWVDPATSEPVSMRGAAAKLPAFVDRLELLMEYGPAENGHTQLRRAVLDAVGGFAIYFKHYRIEAELSDYQSLAR
jgi:hypothetical protein